MIEVYCGIDIGTSSVKAATFDREFNLIDRVKRNYSLYSDKKNRAELDPEEVYQETLNCLTSLKQSMKGDFKFISLSSALHSLIAVKENYKPLTRCMTWADSRAMEFKTQLEEFYSLHSLYEITGCPPHAMYFPAKILWLKKYRPEIFAKTYKFITIKEYIIKKMTGKEIVDYSLASAGGLLNLAEKTWEDILLDYLEITTDHLGKLVDAQESSKISREVREKIKTEAQLVTGSGDGPLANLGVGALRENDYVVTIGSSGAIRIFSKKPILDEKKRTWCYMLDKDIYLPGGAINNGGIVLSWLKENMFKNSEPDEIFYNKIDNILKELPPGSGGLLFLPFLSGERSPNWNSSARGIMIGLGLEHDQKNIVKAALEGITFRMYSVFKALEDLGGRKAKIIASGGFTGSEPWLQLLADVFDRKVVAYEKYEASAAGAAMIGAVACDDFSHYKEISPEFSIKTVKTPRPKIKQKYDKIYPLHNQIYDSNKKFFDKMQEI